MAFDLGGSVPLSVSVRDSSGTLVNASTITLAITLPDGTAVSPAPSVTNPPAVTGQYTYSYSPTAQHGRYRVRWVATSPATASTDIFHVRAAAPIALISLAEGKAHLNISSSTTTYDDELRDTIECASDVAEFYAGAMARRTLTERYSGRGRSALLLRHRAISITTVTVNGTAIDSTGYSLSDCGGILYRVAGYRDYAWLAGRNNISIIYEAGMTGQVISASVIEAVKELVRINFRPQIGGGYSPFDQGRGDDFGTPSGGQMRFGFFVPNIVMQRLQVHATPGIG